MSYEWLLLKEVMAIGILTPTPLMWHTLEIIAPVQLSTLSKNIYNSVESDHHLPQLLRGTALS